MGGRAPSSYEELPSSSRHQLLPPRPMANSKEERADQAELSRVPQLWGSLIDEGLQQVQQGGLSPPASRRWLHVDHSGSASLVEVDKHRVVAELGVRYRDLLALDPTVPIPFPASILIRERALVVNLETVRMIICANQCYILSVPMASNPRVASFPTLQNPFVKELCKVLQTGKSTSTLHDLSRGSAAFDYDSPYELRALEAALATVVSVVDREVFDLEREAYPTIDRLASNVSRRVLEHVRAVKQVMGKLIGRVQRLKSELEEILNDDADMQDMYLARRAAMLGEELPPDPLSGTIASTQSTQDMQRLLPLSPKSHISTADSVHAVAAGTRPASGQGMVHPASAASLASIPAALAAPGAAVAATASAAPRYAVSEGADPAAAPSRLGRGGHQPGPPLPPQHHLRPHSGLAGRAAASHSTAALQRPTTAAEHLGHHVHHSAPDLAGSDGSRHGHHARNHGSSGIGLRKHGGGGSKQHWQRAHTIVRTVRRLRKSKGRGSTAASPTAEQAAAADEASPREAAAAGPAEGLETASSAPAAIRTESAVSEAGSDVGDSDAEVIETYIEQPAMPAVDPHDVEEAEDMLEAFYIQVDGILRRLLLVSERIDDTEDLVAIQMDHRRNELVATDLLVTITTAGFAWAAMIAGIFGMNLWNTVWQEDKAVFVAVMLVTIVGSVALVGGLVAWVRHRRLMFIPTVEASRQDQ